MWGKERNGLERIWNGAEWERNGRNPAGGEDKGLGERQGIGKGKGKEFPLSGEGEGGGERERESLCKIKREGGRWEGGGRSCPSTDPVKF